MPVERAFLDGEVVRMVVAVAVIVVEIDADVVGMFAVVGMGMSEAHGRARPGDQQTGRQEVIRQSPGSPPVHRRCHPQDRTRTTGLARLSQPHGRTARRSRDCALRGGRPTRYSPGAGGMTFRLGEMSFRSGGAGLYPLHRAAPPIRSLTGSAVPSGPTGTSGHSRPRRVTRTPGRIASPGAAGPPLRFSKAARSPESLAWYLLAALGETGGCFTFWAWLRMQRSPLWAVPARTRSSPSLWSSPASPRTPEARA